MSEVITVQDLETLKKHEIFEAEVITGKVGGLAAGADIDYATNAATGQTQKTLPAILRDIGFTPAAFDFTSGGTLGVNDRDKAVLWPLADGGDGDWYNWEGVLPKVVPAASTPYTTGGVANGAWRPVGDVTLREELAAPNGVSLVGGAVGAADLSAPTGATMIGAGVMTQAAKNQETVSTSDFAKTVPTMAQINGVVGQNVFSRLTLAGFHVSGDKGGGVFYWDPAKPKTAHNGGTIIDPDIVFPADWNNATQVTAWYTAALSGTGCWVRQQELGYLMAEWFGARPWVIGGTQDSTKPFQQCAIVADRGGSWKWAGRHRITSFVEIPPKQTFGSFGQMTSVSVELFDPENFQGVHTSPFPAVADKIDSACFYDATTGEAFRCNEGAEPVDFLLYGRGYNTTGMSLTPNLPPASSYYDTSGIRHGKYIKPRNVTIILFKHPFDSFPWSTGGSFVGDYYSTHTDCEVTWCYDILRVATSPSYNTKFVNLRALVNRIGDFGVEARNLQFVGGAIEGFNAASDIRLRSSTSFVGTYFETTATNFNGVVFNLVGFTTLTFRDCLVFLNGVNIFVSSGGSGQSTGVNYLTLNSSGNTWRRTDALAGTVFSVAAVPNKTVGIFGDVIDLSNVGSALTYYTGPVPPGIYSPAITLNP